LRISAGFCPAISSGRATLSNAVREDSRLKCWNTMPMSRRAWFSARSPRDDRSYPSTRTVPLVGRSSRLMQRISVLLPAPLRPMTPKISPRPTVRLTLSSATTGAVAPG
jgi:hypothetical protein